MCVKITKNVRSIIFSPLKRRFFMILKVTLFHTFHVYSMIYSLLKYLHFSSMEGSLEQHEDR